jgi:SAM-dependent methyltransferase
MTTSLQQVRLPLSSSAISSCVCPVCGEKSDRQFQKYKIWIRGCGNCGHQFAEYDADLAHAQQVYSDLYFFGGGAGYPNYLSGAHLLRHHGQSYGRLLARYMSPGRVLDIGAAAGFLLQGLQSTGWRGEGVEPNPVMADYGRRHLGLTMHTATLETFELSVDDQGQPSQDHLAAYDLISMIQVLPHLWDLHQAMQQATALTRPGGYWLIETWNRESATAWRWGQSWHEYSPPSVLHWFSPTGVTQLVQPYGFQLIAQGRPQKWIGGSHLKSLLHYKLGRSPLAGVAKAGLGLIPDRLALPYLGDDLMWLLFQHQP